jgi:hypothetical protein
VQADATYNLVQREVAKELGAEPLAKKSVKLIGAESTKVKF